ncbi:hypothetical protein F5Y16DRAFT_423607 [Xylariaceae sp. FL0255]|nr:hypothetical protein F5Y16DRAFT_423607 [Xylariaceae sp. FL0255]
MPSTVRFPLLAAVWAFVDARWHRAYLTFLGIRLFGCWYIWLVSCLIHPISIHLSCIIHLSSNLYFHISPPLSPSNPQLLVHWITDLIVVDSVFSIDYVFVFGFLMYGDDDRDKSTESTKQLNGAVILLIVSAIFKLYWFVAWLQCLVLTWCWRMLPVQASKNSIQQVSSEVASDLRSIPEIRFDERRKMRSCRKRCGEIGDRVYHCSRLRQCLPLYNHYCPWFKVAIYLPTIKPYCHACLWLVLDGLYVLIMSFIALGLGKRDHGEYFRKVIPPALISGFLVLIVAYRTVATYFDLIVRRNACLRLKAFDDPWDLGFRANWHQIFGESVFQWLVPFWNPGRVSLYGKRGATIFTWNQEVRDFQNHLLVVPLAGVTVDDVQVDGVPADRQEPVAPHATGPSRRGLSRSEGVPRQRRRSNRPASLQ